MPRRSNRRGRPTIWLPHRYGTVRYSVPKSRFIPLAHGPLCCTPFSHDRCLRAQLAMRALLFHSDELLQFIERLHQPVLERFPFLRGSRLELFKKLLELLELFLGLGRAVPAECLDLLLNLGERLLDRLEDGELGGVGHSLGTLLGLPGRFFGLAGRLLGPLLDFLCCAVRRIAAGDQQCAYHEPDTCHPGAHHRSYLLRTPKHEMAPPERRAAIGQQNDQSLRLRGPSPRTALFGQPGWVRSRVRLMNRRWREYRGGYGTRLR